LPGTRIYLPGTRIYLPETRIYRSETGDYRLTTGIYRFGRGRENVEALVPSACRWAGRFAKRLYISLVAERTNRIDFRGAARGEVAGDEGDRDEAKGDGDKCHRVVGGNAEQDRVEEAGEEKGGDEARDNAETGELESSAEDELEDVRPRRAEGHADADLFVTLRNEIRDDSINAEAGKGERENR